MRNSIIALKLTIIALVTLLPAMGIAAGWYGRVSTTTLINAFPVSPYSVRALAVGPKVGVVHQATNQNGLTSQTKHALLFGSSVKSDKLALDTSELFDAIWPNSSGLSKGNLDLGTMQNPEFYQLSEILSANPLCWLLTNGEFRGSETKITSTVVESLYQDWANARQDVRDSSMSKIMLRLNHPENPPTARDLLSGMLYVAVSNNVDGILSSIATANPYGYSLRPVFLGLAVRPLDQQTLKLLLAINSQFNSPKKSAADGREEKPEGLPCYALNVYCALLLQHSPKAFAGLGPKLKRSSNGVPFESYTYQNSPFTARLILSITQPEFAVQLERFEQITLVNRKKLLELRRTTDL